MKNTLKKTLSLLLALTMVLSLGLPAYAVGVPQDDLAIVEEPADKTANLPIGAGKTPGIIGEDEIISDDLIVDIVDEETVVEETAAPARSFTYSEAASGFAIEVSAPAGALPLGTEMVVDRLVDLADVQAAVDAAENLEGEVQLAAYISFWLNGQEIEPAEGTKLLVRMSAPEIEGIADPVVIHLPDGENAVPEIVEQMSADDDLVLVNTVEFEAADFSVYAVIGEVIIEDEEGTIDFASDAYTVTVSYTKEAKIPVGTKLIVSEIPYGSEEYYAYLAAAQEKLNENATFGSEEDTNTRRSIADAIFVDVSLEYNGKPFEPAVPLDVKITLNEAALFCPAGEEALVVHFGDKGTELIEDVAVGLSAYEVPAGMPEGLLLNSFDYEQNGFSVVGLFTTDVFIDFEKAEPIETLPSVFDLLAPLAAGDPTINAGKTVTDANGDGIYELALSVNATSSSSSTASVTKSNVVMVIDVSGSMGNDDSWVYYSAYTYDASTYNQFRYYSSSSSTNTRLYYGQYRTGGGGSTVSTGWYSGGNTYNGNVYYATAYSGTVYAYETRLHATQRAACAVVDALLAYNTNADNITDIFEITLIQFSNSGRTNVVSYNNTAIRDKTDATLIKNGINSLTATGGTNWQAALTLAKTEADYFKNEGGNENTSVIFLTDGFPTRYGTGTGNNENGTGQENNNNIANSYSGARDSARAIKTAGYTLYNIFAFGSDTVTYNNHTGFAYLCALANYAYGSGTGDNFSTTTAEARQYCFNAKSTDALVAAFNTIINHITNSVGFAGVNISDGVSLGATSTSVAVNGTAKPDSMRYTVTDSSGNLSYTVKFSNGKAVFTIYNEDGTTTTLEDSTPETVTTEIDPANPIISTVYSVTVGEGDAAETFEMSPATIDADTGMVKWDLAGLGILKSGYTYTVAFDVWPQQLTYDIAADLNNGIYADVDEALDAYKVPEADRQRIKDAIVQNTDGSYAIYTNYEQSVEYYPATEITDDDGNTSWEYGTKQTNELPHPDPVPLQGSSLPLSKVWESTLAISELNELLWEDGIVGGTSKEYQITLHVWKADTEAELMTLVEEGDVNNAYITKILGWDAEAGEYIFEKDAAVAPGMMLNVTEAAALGYDVTDESKLREFTNDQDETLTYYVIEAGHYYFVTEDGSDLHFELESPLYHPMIVDGTLYNVFFGPNQTVERMDPMYAVVATNYLKGGLNITKIVTDFEGNEIADVEDEFAFKITLWKEEEDGSISPVYTYDEQFGTDNKAISGSIGYREFGKITDEETGARETLGRNVIVFEDSTDAAAKIAANKRGTNDPVYATKTADNKTQIILRMPACGEIRIVNLPSGTKYTVEEIVDTSDEAVYEYVQSRSGIKFVGPNEDEAGEDGEPVIEEQITWDDPVTTNQLSGTISGNKANVAEFTNKTDAYFYVYHSADNGIEKISFSDNRVAGEYDAENGYTYTFNIAKETKDHYIYGGYYKDYADKGTFDVTTASFVKTAEAVATTYDGEHADGYWFTVTEGSPAPYLGDASKWTRAQAYTENGTAMQPAVDMVYFLKEVPDEYMRGALRYTYYDNADKNIGTVWLATAIDDEAGDDKNYKEFGLLIGFDFANLSSESSAAGSTAASLRIETRTDSNVFKTYTAGDMLKPINADFANAKGFVGYVMIRDVSIYGNGSMPDSLVENNQKTALYWVTPDDVQVTGVRVSSVDHIGGTASTIKLSKFGKYETAEKDITSTLIYVGA